MYTFYTYPELKDLSVGSRIAFVRKFRRKTQDNISKELGLTSDNRRRTMTRYEKGERNPKEERTREIANILDVSYNSIKYYDFSNKSDLFYLLMWIEELYPNFGFKMNLQSDEKISNAFIEWNEMKKKRLNEEITYEEYIEWKLKYEIDKE